MICLARIAQCSGEARWLLQCRGNSRRSQRSADHRQRDTPVTALQTTVTNIAVRVSARPHAESQISHLQRPRLVRHICTRHDFIAKSGRNVEPYSFPFRPEKIRRPPIERIEIPNPERVPVCNIPTQTCREGVRLRIGRVPDIPGRRRVLPQRPITPVVREESNHTARWRKVRHFAHSTASTRAQSSSSREPHAECPGSSERCRGILRSHGGEATR